jgi:NADPH:quinone reductase-like Zn-dependent oxidoreductase
MSMMKAAVLRELGGPEQLRLETVPIPAVDRDEVLIRVKAFGLNRSEKFTRQGDTPDVKLPRILGIEAVGFVEEVPSGGFHKGDIVATVMGGMGREFDGGYAEYTVVPASQVLAVHTQLTWEVLGALPEMLQTAWGALHRSLELQQGEHLLIRGGTSSIGLAALALARSVGAVVSSTTRNPARASFLRDLGAAAVFIDTGSIQDQVRQKRQGGVDKVLELVGTSTLLDSLLCTRERGVVCATGIVGNERSLRVFSPSAAIPTAVRLTTYGGTSADLLQMPFEQLAGQIATGALRIPLAKTFHLDEIVEAHRYMEENKALGKIVVLT